jgi:hypothetical protein
MDPITLAAILGATGLAKSELIDRPKEERQRKVAAETLRWSPWTGITPAGIKEADPFGSALQGAAVGAMVGQAGGEAGAADATKSKDVAELSLTGGTEPMVGQSAMQEQLYKNGGYIQTPGRMQATPWQGMRQYGLS